MRLSPPLVRISVCLCLQSESWSVSASSLNLRLSPPQVRFSVCLRSESPQSPPPVRMHQSQPPVRISVNLPLQPESQSISSYTRPSCPNLSLSSPLVRIRLSSPLVRISVKSPPLVRMRQCPPLVRISVISASIPSLHHSPPPFRISVNLPLQSESPSVSASSPNIRLPLHR